MHDDPELIAMVHDAHVRGLGHEEVFTALGGRGVPKSAAIVYYAKGAGVPDDEARRLVEGSPLWDPRVQEDREAFQEDVERLWFLMLLIASVEPSALDDPGDDEVLLRQARARAHLVEVAALLPREALAPYDGHLADGLHADAFADLVAVAREHGLPDDGWRGLAEVADQLCLHEWEDGPEEEEFVAAARFLRAR
ncbi:hypothetical protein [Saccharothrix luteola]|uniref:hypothetical protein n=1 Tax=Saccharothrix luteola TaxID=2893018 RepID=UPI001E432342|nr:hypothetical protein [Saccharothrix luteola]MCC8244167.1 hypothetical protein [Saccharothrix luteola]MCC8250889.1 hypothetical protein [Saccharothrix luteola]